MDYFAISHAHWSTSSWFFPLLVNTSFSVLVLSVCISLCVLVQLMSWKWMSLYLIVCLCSAHELEVDEYVSYCVSLFSSWAWSGWVCILLCVLVQLMSLKWLSLYLTVCTCSAHELEVDEFVSYCVSLFSSWAGSGWVWILLCVLVQLMSWKWMSLYLIVCTCSAHELEVDEFVSYCVYLFSSWAGSGWVCILLCVLVQLMSWKWMSLCLTVCTCSAHELDVDEFVSYCVYLFSSWAWSGWVCILLCVLVQLMSWKWMSLQLARRRIGWRPLRRVNASTSSSKWVTRVTQSTNKRVNSRWAPTWTTC